MRVLIINPPWPGKGFGTRSQNRIIKHRSDKFLQYPIFLAYSAAQLKAAGHSVSYIDSVIQDFDMKQTLAEARKEKPDVIVLELGDGLIGAYGVEAILTDENIRNALTGVVLCANDPVSAWGGAKILREQFDIDPAVVTGPATDNSVGIDQIAERLSLQGINALSNGVALGDLIAEILKSRKVA